MYNYIENYSSNSSPESSNPSSQSPSSSYSTCNQGHRSSQILRTEEGGSICILCFTNLITNPNSPTFHVSYALSQLSHALSQPSFLSPLLDFHTYLILSPLVCSLSSFDDEQIARQIVDVVAHLCDSGGFEVSGEFVARISGVLSSGELAWNRRQVYTLHCLGLLLTNHMDTYACIKDKAGLINNLVTGLQLPSEEIRGEIMFVLYRISILQCSSEDENDADVLLEYCSVILRLSLDALMKTQRDDVRLNCLALLKVLAQRGFLSASFSTEFDMMDSGCEADNYTLSSNGASNGCSMSRLFAEAIKSPLLSPDSQVQISTLNLIVQWLSGGNCSVKQIQVLVEENLTDYIFEILRLSESKDQIVSSCVQVLDHLSTAEDPFRQRC